MLNIPIFLAADNHYAPFVATTIASICDHTKSFCSFYVLDSGISDAHKFSIESLQRVYQNFSVCFLPVDEKTEFSSVVYHNTAHYISLSTYNRFLIPKLKPDLKKVLYLDVDVIVQGDIQELFCLPLEGYPLAAVAESFTPKEEAQNIRNRLSLLEKHPYFNAGVLLIDNQQWVQKDILKQALALEKNMRPKLLWADQDILNVLFNGNYKELPSQFNHMTQFKKNNHNVLVRHFNTNLKPWQFSLDEAAGVVEDVALFWQYASKTPFYSMLLQKKEASLLNSKQEAFYTRIYKLFGLFPLIKEVSYAKHKKKWYLLGCLPFLKATTIADPK